MIDTIFRYTEEIDTKIKTTVEQILKSQVVSSSKITQGEVNHVYTVTTENSVVIARVFRRPHWPEDGKLPWIEEHLTKNGIPHAQTLYYSRDDTYFPYGLMISDFVAGKNGIDAICDGDVSFETFHEKLAKLLKQVHSIEIKKFGQINNGAGQYDNYIDYRVNKLPTRLNQITDDSDFDPLMVQKIETVVRKNLESLENKFKPVLVHGDPTPDNTIYTSDGQIILIDWDGALSDIWLWDYAWMTYWGSHLSKFGDIEERRQKTRESFIHGYGDSMFMLDEIDSIEHTLHILQAVDLLPYYYSDHKNREAYDKTKKKLYSLLALYS
ncbi:MAG: aminoglycoside phosphotransferase family protein [bacterium]|nr:aminoglycoside phosphotransferase family protein [bacterium]